MKVSIVECGDYDEGAVRRAIDTALKSIDFTPPAGKKVLIKPNILSQHKPDEAITTHPAVVGALVDIFTEKGCEVFVGDSSATCRHGGTCRALDISHLREAAEKRGAKAYNLESLPVTKIHDKTALVYRDLEISSLVFDVDLVVNACKMKTHSLMSYTGAVKNLFGTIPGGRKQQLHALAPAQTDFANILVDIYQNVRPQLNVMDAIVGLEGNGPGKAGRPKQTGLILASADAPSLDIVASRIMGFDPLEILTNRACIERKLLNPEEVEVIGSEKKVPYKKPISISRVPSSLVGWGIKTRSRVPVVDKKKCIKCGLCATICPAKAIKLDPYPIIDANRCISCYCCHETCPEAALDLKPHGILRIRERMENKKTNRGKINKETEE